MNYLHLDYSMNLKAVKTLTTKDRKSHDLETHFTCGTKFCVLPSLLSMPMPNIVSETSTHSNLLMNCNISLLILVL